MASINVNGIASEMWTKLRTLHKAKYDIMLLQETKLKDADINDNLLYRWQQVSDGEAYSSPAASSQAGGVAILLSSYACSILQDREQIPVNSDRHRQIILGATLFGHKVFLQSIYAPVRRTERPDFFNNLTSPIAQGSHVIGGDFNCIMDPFMDTRGDPNLASAGSSELTTWLASMEAIDPWRLRHEHKQEFTSPSGNSRIDMIFISGCFTNNFTARHAARTIGSDHLVPLLTTASCEVTTGGGHWQLPTWLPRQAAQRIKPVLEKLTTSTSNPNYYETFSKSMKDITGRCMAVHKQVLRWRKDKLQRAKLRWIRAHYRAIATPTDECMEDAEAARRAWIEMAEKEESIRRARAFDKHFSEAERCTAFFLRRPRKKNVSIIPGVRRSDGSISNNPHHVQSEHKAFWSNLYSVDSAGMEPPPTTTNIANLTNLHLPRLPDSAARSLECPISEDDRVNQINRLPVNKAAGADGIRAELIKQNPRLWAKILLPIFEDLLHRHKELPQTLRDTVIILLHKKGCTLQPKNYRPIALLNVTAKLLSGIHNERLRRILKDVIPPEQTGFIPSRSISENIILLQDAIHYAKRHNPSAIILALDFEKAYDRVQWEVMLAVIRKLNFGSRWCNVISSMYKHRSARLSINGVLSPTFPIERGVLQGDPLSPALFILQCSPLYSKLSSQRTVHGIPLPHNNFSPVATFYADDTNLIARSPTSAVALYDIANWFCANSGAKIHPNKCIAIPTGPAPSHLSNGIKILNPNQDTTILGVPMGMLISRQQQTERVVAKMVSRCQRLAHIGRTIDGRVTVARALILSTIWYVLGALPTNADEAKKTQNMTYNFLNCSEDYDWDGPAARGNMARIWFHRSRNDGGWGLAPILRTLKARKLTLLRSFLSDHAKGKRKPWHTFITHMLMEHMHNWSDKWEDIVLWKGEQKQGDFGIGQWDALSPWWREAWQEWLKLRCYPDTNSFTRYQLRRWPVWNNRLLEKNHGINSVLYRAFTNSGTRAHMKEIRTLGFLTFSDFMNDDGAIMNGRSLYTAVTVRLSVHDSDHIVPQHACDSLCRVICALWANTKKNWLRQSAHSPQQNGTKWHPHAMPNTSFVTASNAAITKMAALSEREAHQPKLIALNNRPISICWPRETSALKQLAPTRRDLLKRLIRNALPLGSKRIHWTTPCQTICLLCDSNTIETAEHTFWECTYARESWGRLHLPWRNQARNGIGWKEILLGHEVRLGALDNKHTEQLWAIIRGCIIRAIWLERNRRYFYPELTGKQANYRWNQGFADIKAHILAWLRRSDNEEKEKLHAAVNILANKENIYSSIRTATHSVSTHTLPPDHNGTFT